MLRHIASHSELHVYATRPRKRPWKGKFDACFFPYVRIRGVLIHEGFKFSRRSVPRVRFSRIALAIPWIANRGWLLNFHPCYSFWTKSRVVSIGNLKFEIEIFLCVFYHRLLPYLRTYNYFIIAWLWLPLWSRSESNLDRILFIKNTIEYLISVVYFVMSVFLRVHAKVEADCFISFRDISYTISQNVVFRKTALKFQVRLAGI